MTVRNGTYNTTLRAIEEDRFPFEYLSQIAEVESWRKEIHRPNYHIHKWWAQRLGSVFRGILLGVLAGPREDILRNFYQPTRLQGVVFDPFMGSGTTVGEALKLGLHAIGRDINPVAASMVKVALSKHDRREVQAEFNRIDNDVGQSIRERYTAIGPDGSPVDVLYYFWVKVVQCPGCSVDVDLFSSYVFAKNAYSARKPLCRIVCRDCGEVFDGKYGNEHHACPKCRAVFMAAGPVRGAKAECPHCQRTFPIADAIRAEGVAPRHRMYAKLVLDKSGRKHYMRTDETDETSYRKTQTELDDLGEWYPTVAIKPGHNTNQVLNYGYKYWHDMFNSRQLLCLGILAQRIKSIDDVVMRELFTTLFSGALEFNNMFASFKGEGTGAVRHMFSHHVLKPERMPIEANVWGTGKSSGAFSTLFKSRLLRALEYSEQPFEVKLNGAEKKAFGLSQPLAYEVAESYREFSGSGAKVYVSCGDSASVDIPDGSVDAVVTDPPFFDNVHYSELADFFYVWQRHILGTPGSPTTRRPEEVQSTDAGVFADRLAGVLRECHRILKDDGVLAFTYHHSRHDGWNAVMTAIMTAGFRITAVQPVKSEMSVATPKSQASHPIDLDIVFVCRKSVSNKTRSNVGQDFTLRAKEQALSQSRRFLAAGRRLGYGDLRVLLAAHVVKDLSRLEDQSQAATQFEQFQRIAESALSELSETHSSEPVTKQGQLSFAEGVRL